MNRPSSPRRPSPASTAQAPQEVRIIGGQWKRTPLPVKNAPGLRPTPARVRETLFNWLGQDLTGWRCLDAFAGSGALGMESASRGAAEVLMLELDRGLVDSLKGHAQRLGATQVRVQTGDALAALRSAPAGVWDVVFLDPPFGDPKAGGNEALFRHALQAAVPLLNAQGWVYLEAPRPWSDAELLALGLACHKRGKAGTVHYHLLARAAPAVSGDNLLP